ncbi:MAG: hypothetical protein IH947_06305, partial [Bacteroidetes bacterium]|nr:hypothetical protein [Bacteroidota bacterium]
SSGKGGGTPKRPGLAQSLGGEVCDKRRVGGMFLHGFEKKVHRSARILPLISSTAKRALSTARKIAREIGYNKKNIVKTRFLYHADEDAILELIRQQNDAKDSVMLFGHNPSFTDCVNMLTNANIANVPTCGVVEITFNTGRWSDINKYEGTLVFFDYPKKSQE